MRLDVIRVYHVLFETTIKTTNTQARQGKARQSGRHAAGMQASRQAGSADMSSGVAPNIYVQE
jgi:hypothetical protein